MGGTLYQGLLVHADGRFVADVEMGAGVVRALRMARSEAAGGAGWRDLTGKLVFPGPVVLCRSDAPPAWLGGPPATTVAVPVASLGPPAGQPPPVDAVPVPLLRGVVSELEVLPDAVFGRGCAAFAVDDRILSEADFDGDLVRVTGHCGATLVVLSDDARTMERSVGGLPLPLDGGRVVVAPSDAAGMRAALDVALRSGEPGSGIAVAAPAHLLLAEPQAAAEWWPAVRAGMIRMVSVAAGARTADREFLARLWRAGVAAGTMTLEELAALLCWQPARLLGLPAKGRLHPGCDADLAVLDPEAPAHGSAEEGERRARPAVGGGAAAGYAEAVRGAVVCVLRGGEDGAATAGRWIRATPVREPL
ncbi:MAG: amidohydrolase family protein [Spirochaetaceae bacterium]|nr:amidohydrolase family protein [Spirochaetaceae bacterium]